MTNSLTLDTNLYSFRTQAPLNCTIQSFLKTTEKQKNPSPSCRTCGEQKRHDHSHRWQNLDKHSRSAETSLSSETNNRTVSMTLTWEKKLSSQLIPHRCYRHMAFKQTNQYLTLACVYCYSVGTAIVKHRAVTIVSP